MMSFSSGVVLRWARWVPWWVTSNAMLSRQRARSDAGCRPADGNVSQGSPCWSHQWVCLNQSQPQTSTHSHRLWRWSCLQVWTLLSSLIHVYIVLFCIITFIIVVVVLSSVSLLRWLASCRSSWLLPFNVTLTLLVGRQEGHPACKHWMLVCWWWPFDLSYSTFWHIL